MRILLIICGLLMSALSWAAVDAVVIAEKAVVWADIQRSAPLGYLAKGKIIRVGELTRNKNQVVAIAISGRIGYISTDDISFDLDPKAAPEERRYERFKDVANKKDGTLFMFGVTGFNATERKNTADGRRGDNWNFIGGTIKGEVATSVERLGIIFIGDYLYAENKPETFRVFDLSLGVSFALINAKYVKLKAEVAGIVVPYVQYESDPLFTLNGYGYGAIAQGALDIFFNEQWGVEGSLGIQTLQFNGIDRPAPFTDFSPLFSGTRWFAGIVRRF